MSFSQKVTAIFFAFWAGLISAISFLEAWLKFRADGVTREIGLSIGSLVFTVLNRIELIILALVWALFILTNWGRVLRLSVQNIMLYIVSIVLVVQTLWLLPTLLHRANEIIAGNEPQSSSVHVVFVVFEFVKLVLLITLSIKVLSNNEKIASKL